jgi:hypothetical protein
MRFWASHVPQCALTAGGVLLKAVGSAGDLRLSLAGSRGPARVTGSIVAAAAVVCVGIPFGHTRPQWIVPHGGAITVDGAARRVVADYSQQGRSAPEPIPHQPCLRQ